jgi:regulator of protease activity HflC (stomatin/prohibitin superfamily)
MTGQNSTGREGTFDISRALKPLVLSGTAILFACGLIAVLLSGAVAALVMLLGVIALFLLVVNFIQSKARVLRDKEVPLWSGWAKLVAWDPGEGILFLKNKKPGFCHQDPKDGGGISLIYAGLGEEVATRVPLEFQTLPVTDHEVLTKECIPLIVRATIWWRIVDVTTFYLSLSREVHEISDRGRHTVLAPTLRPQLETAEKWLRTMAEETTRTIVSRIGTGLLIADHLPSDVSVTVQPTEALLTAIPESSTSYRTATEGLAAELEKAARDRVAQYGIQIHRVSLQEVKFPPDIYAAAVDACRSSYLPLKAHAEAIAKKMALKAEVDVLGAEAVGMREITSNIPALAIQDLLTPIFADYARRRGSGAPALPDPGEPEP